MSCWNKYGKRSCKTPLRCDILLRVLRKLTFLGRKKKKNQANIRFALVFLPTQFSSGNTSGLTWKRGTGGYSLN